MHVGLCDKLDDDRDTPLPDPHGLVVRGGHEAPVIVNEGDRVHRAEVLIVLLCDLPSVYVPLDDFLVRAASQEVVLEVLVRVELDAVGDLLVREARDALPGLCVPQLDVLVKAAAQEPLSVIGEAHIAHHLGVANEGSQTVSLIVHVPKLENSMHHKSAPR